MIDTSDSNPEPTRSPSLQNRARNIRDVADFHLRWPEFRPIAAALGRNPALSDDEADTLAWMIELLDRIGQRDVDEGAK